MSISLTSPFRSLLKQVRTPSRSANPLLLLDIDGAIAPFHSLPTGEPVQHITSNPYMTWTVKETVSEWLHTLNTSNVDIRWASTWEQEANLLSQALNLPDFPHLLFPNTKEDEWVKLTAVRKFVYAQPARRKILWIDDEIDDDTRNWASTICNLSLIIPDSRTGLTDEQMETATAFLTAPDLEPAGTDTL